MTTRRGFLAGIFVAGLAPAFVGSKVLMPVKQIILPNPLHFGNMVWRPELTMQLPIDSLGELTVQPMFRHIVSMPVMGILNLGQEPALRQRKRVLSQDARMAYLLQEFNK